MRHYYTNMPPVLQIADRVWYNMHRFTGGKMGLR